MLDLRKKDRLSSMSWRFNSRLAEKELLPTSRNRRNLLLRKKEKLRRFLNASTRRSER